MATRKVKLTDRQDVSPLFAARTECPNCQAKYKTMRVRPSFKKPVSTDSDFCMYFGSVNPDYYVVRVCPHCGFASTESFSQKTLSDSQRSLFQEKIGRHWTKRDYTGERTAEMAMVTYKLALVCAQIKDESDRIIAGLLHHIAWLYRYRQDTANESRFLAFALEAYIRVFQYEGLDYNNARLMYLIGELNRRLGQYADAVRWFSRVVNDKRIVDAAMIRRSREQWQTMREDMQRLKLELPEDDGVRGA